MSTKFLGKVVAGAALGGACMLVGTPGIASAAAPPTTEPGQVSAKPQWAKPGEEVTLVEVCTEAQESPWIWSEVTGKLELEPQTAPEMAAPEKPQAPGIPAAPGDTPPAPEEAPPAADLGPVEEYAPQAVEPTAEPIAEPDVHADSHANDHADGHADADGPAAAEEPADGEQSGAHTYWATTEIPGDATPGHYKLKGSCGFGTLVVVPTGWVEGGDGGAGGNGLATGGAAMLGAAAIGGIVLMRRRRTDGSVV
ncbi:hypothetical protein [Micromonospora sp. NPDC004704]